MDNQTSVEVIILVSEEDADKLRSGLYRVEVRPIAAVPKEVTMPDIDEVARVMYQAYIDKKYPELVNHPDLAMSNANAWDRILQDPVGDRFRSYWLAAAEAAVLACKAERRD